MWDILQVTAEYSNAVLVAVLPYVSDFSARIQLPVPQPVAISQVAHFECSSRSDHIGGRVVLTNGCEFTFDRGRIALYRSPRCYFHLQDPDRIPAFYGTVKLNQTQAVQIASVAISKLGYSEASLYADRKPEVTPPLRIGTNYVARYLVRWTDPNVRRNPQSAITSIEFEVDATTGEIDMMSMPNTNTWRPPPKVDVHPPVVGKAPETTLRGGRTIVPVSQAYSNAFLIAILPELSSFAKNAGFVIPKPLTTNQVNLPRLVCGLVDDDPIAVVYLTNGSRFNYNHGLVTAFYASDACLIPGDKDGNVADYFGKDNMTKIEAVSLVRKAIQQLGYSNKILLTDATADVVPPQKYGANLFARYFLSWREPDEGAYRVAAEVDATTKTLKSLYINDHANTNIWREPPKINVSPTTARSP